MIKPEPDLAGTRKKLPPSSDRFDQILPQRAVNKIDENRYLVPYQIAVYATRPDVDGAQAAW